MLACEREIECAFVSERESESERVCVIHNVGIVTTCECVCERKREYLCNLNSLCNVCERERERERVREHVCLSV